jgi:hypothetical protein
MKERFPFMSSENVVRVTPYHMGYSLDCGEHGETERFIRFFDNETALFRYAAKMYAFNDCCPCEIHWIAIDGVDYEYTGWQPGMRYQFRDCETKAIIFDECFPEWDH